jgi:mRNA deadenylase 3'-5' endonuclease subunit Ccr4
VKVVSYNILADSYIRPERYPHAETLFLDKAFRKEALLKQVVSFNADIICLQEVECDVLALLDKELEEYNYKSIFVKKGMGRPDGVATYFKKGAVAFLGANALYFKDQHHFKQFPSGHAALLVYLQFENTIIGVINTHIRWDDPLHEGDKHVGYRQMQELTHWIQRDQKAEEWLICGDFNSDFDTPVINFLFDLGLTDVFGKTKEWTINIGGLGRVDYFFHSRGLIANPHPVMPIDQKTILPNKEHPSDHAFIVADFSLV